MNLFYGYNKDNFATPSLSLSLSLSPPSTNELYNR